MDLLCPCPSLMVALMRLRVNRMVLLVVTLSVRMLLLMLLVLLMQNWLLLPPSQTSMHSHLRPHLRPSHPVPLDLRRAFVPRLPSLAPPRLGAPTLDVTIQLLPLSRLLRLRPQLLLLEVHCRLEPLRPRQLQRLRLRLLYLPLLRRLPFRCLLHQHIVPWTLHGFRGVLPKTKAPWSTRVGRPQPRNPWCLQQQQPLQEGGLALFEMLLFLLLLQQQLLLLLEDVLVPRLLPS